MKLATLTSVAVLVVRHVSASPPNNVLTPSGIPATSGLSFSTLSFDTTAASSVLSGLSSLISSESTAIMPYTATTTMPIPTTYSYSTPTSTSTSSTPATLTSVVVAPTRKSAARRSGDVRLADVGLVFGAVAAALVW